jgi:regulatory protein spx
MIKIYLSPSCSSCRKVKAWFIKEGIPFEEVNILKHEITPDEIKEMLNKSLDGTDEIISTRSKVFQEQHVDVDSMSINELCEFIKKNPTILKRPIIVDNSIIQVGYNADEIEIFQRAKKVVSETCRKGVCPNYDTCEHRQEEKPLVKEQTFR